MALLFTLPRVSTIDLVGVVAPRARLYFYQTGTSTPQPIYADSGLSTPLDQPVTASDAGLFRAIYLNDTLPDYKIVCQDDNGSELWTVDPYINGVSQAQIGASLYPRTPAEQAAIVTPANYFYPSDATGEINIKRYGAGSSQSTSQNKAHIQTAISVANQASSPGCCFIKVPQDCPYGYVATTKLSHPDFTSVTRDMVIIDHTPGASYSSPARDGMQVRYFYHTPQTTPVGQHDGNGQWIRGDWHPYIIVSNDGGPQSPRTANDNRRASILFASDGHIRWRFGQSTLSSASASDDELSNLGLDIFGHPTLGDITTLIVSRLTGNWLFNTGSNAESASYHFKSRTTGYVNAILESLTTECRLLLRNSDGSADDVEIQNNDGALEFHIGAQGDALIIEKANRRATWSAAVVDAGLTVPYSASMSPNSSAGNYHVITATDANAFTINAPTNTPGTAVNAQQLTITIRNTSGGALGAATWNAVFKMAAWTNPGNGNSRSITFRWNGTNWVEVTRTAADVPN